MYCPRKGAKKRIVQLMATSIRYALYATICNQLQGMLITSNQQLQYIEQAGNFNWKFKDNIPDNSNS